MMDLSAPIFSKKKIATVILAIIAVACACIYIIYSHKPNLGFSIVPILFLSICLIWITDIWRKILFIKFLPLFWYRVFLLLVIGLPISVLGTLKNKYETYQLQKYGVITDGLVTDAADAQASKGPVYFKADVEYKFDGHLYHQQVNTSTYSYKFGDKLKIRCSSQDPEIFEIISRQPAYHDKY